MEIAKEIVSDIIKAVEDLLWPQPRVEEPVERAPDTEADIEKPGLVQRTVETGALADICLQKYWFRISQGRANLLVFCVFLTNVADIKEWQA